MQPHWQPSKAANERFFERVSKCLQGLPLYEEVVKLAPYKQKKKKSK
jgi:hypothetical protein